MAKAIDNSKKIVFGQKVVGRHSKSYGPKQERPKKYKGQGR